MHWQFIDNFGCGVKVYDPPALESAVVIFAELLEGDMSMDG